MNNYFLSKQPEVLSIRTPATIIEDLNSCLSQWSWEIVSDTEYMDTHVHALGLRLYIPGRILYNYFLSTQQELQADIKKAIFSCCTQVVTPVQNTEMQQAIKEQKETIIPEPQQPQQLNSNNEISDDIMAIIEANKQQIQQQTSTKEENLDNMFNELAQQPKDNIIHSVEQLNSDPREEIPFEDIDPKVAEMMHTGINEDIPENPKEFTPRQITAMKDLKERLHAIEPNENVEEVLARFINTWNPKFSSKHNLTNRNVDDFIAYTNRILASMGK